MCSLGLASDQIQKKVVYHPCNSFNVINIYFEKLKTNLGPFKCLITSKDHFEVLLGFADLLQMHSHL